MVRAMQWRGVSWISIWLGIAALTVVACGRQREPSSQETPTQQTPAAEEAPGEGFAPPPPASEAAREESKEEKKGDLLEREAPAAQGAGRGLGPTAPSDERARPGKPAPAPAKSRHRDDDIGTVGDRHTMSVDIERAEAELQANFERLGDALRLSSPDCPSARQYGARVCELAEHICRLAEKGDEPEELALCVDGRNRCAEVRRRLGERCAE